MTNRNVFISDIPHSDKPQVKTLCFLTRLNELGEQEYLLGIHHKQQKWNGFGGKVGDEKEFENETVEESLMREAKEELNIVLTNFTKKGIGEFTFHKQDVIEKVELHIFFADQWEGEIQSDGELNNLTWFTKENMPWKQMWNSDRPWLEKIIYSKEGEFFSIKVDFPELDENIPAEIEISSNYESKV
ncbi:MAG: NUDIX domain-containing protein [Candidatus Dojkabacteria bacterium]|jgi:8-oxo-dGTP pyrophosphatase MutT (NUDIX family)